jgi:lipoate-protein ligase A
MDKWRVVPLTVADQQYHLDYSQQLLAEVTPTTPATLYWSQARERALVLGLSQKAEQVNQEALQRLALPLYQRRAGGTAVLVGPDLLALDVLLPAGHPLILADVVESYRWLGEVWVAAFAHLGISTRVVAPAEARSQQALLKQPEHRERESILRRACYGALSPYEVVASGRKVVGLDMIRRRAGSLLQAGVLLHWEPESPAYLALLLGQTPAERDLLRQELARRAVGLDDLAGRAISPAEVQAAFQAALERRSP